MEFYKFQINIASETKIPMKSNFTIIYSIKKKYTHFKCHKKNIDGGAETLENL